MGSLENVKEYAESQSYDKAIEKIKDDIRRKSLIEIGKIEKSDISGDIEEGILGKGEIEASKWFTAHGTDAGFWNFKDLFKRTGRTDELADEINIKEIITEKVERDILETASTNITGSPISKVEYKDLWTTNRGTYLKIAFEMRRLR